MHWIFESRIRDSVYDTLVWTMNRIHILLTTTVRKKKYRSTRFGRGGVLPSWIVTWIWSMPNERYTYRGLRTDLGKIISIWPFENSTTVLLVHKVKFKICLNRQSKIFMKAKMFLIPPLHKNILNPSNQVLEGSIFCTIGKKLAILKSSKNGSKRKLYNAKGVKGTFLHLWNFLIV